MPQDVGGTPSTEFGKSGPYQIFQFVKIEIPGFTGSPLRYTDKPGGFIGDIDGASETWTEYDVTIEGIQQTQSALEEISSISIGNINRVWTGAGFAHTLRRKPVTIWRAKFSDTDFKTLIGRWMIYKGRIERNRVTGKRAELALEPNLVTFANMIPTWEITSFCPYNYKDPETCQYVGALPDCGRTRKDCEDHANLLNFGGEDLAPRPGESLPLPQTFSA